MTSEQWERLEVAEVGYEWDAAWEAALAAGAGLIARELMAAARRAGAGPRAAALMAAAISAGELAGLSPAHRRALLLPVALPEPSRSGRCPAFAVAAALVGAGVR